MLRRAGEADAAGIRRPGLVIATEPRALVTTPLACDDPLSRAAAGLRKCDDTGARRSRYLLVLAGLDQVYGDVGEVLPAGTPVGLMGGNAPDADVFLTQATEGGGADRSETLYMELRQGDTPVDPGIWFAFE